MHKKFFSITFTYHGVAYEGRVSPEGSHNDAGFSYNVLLNNVSFGNVSKDKRQWVVNELRPAELLEMVGFCIDKHLAEIVMGN